MALKDLIPAPKKVTLTSGDITVRGISIEEMVKLFESYKPEVIALFEDRKTVDITILLAKAPGLIASIICMATDEPGQEETAKRLVVQDQVEIVSAAVEASVPDAKKFVALLSDAAAAMVEERLRLQALRTNAQEVSKSE